MLSRFRRALRCTVLSALVGLGISGPAHAILVVGVFDPNFGGLLNGTNFSGTATFSVSQSCLDLNLPSIGAFIPYFLPCGGSSSGMGFVGANVNFSPTINPSDPPGHTGQVNFLSDPNAILGMYIRDHEVIGVWSKAIGPRLSDLVGAYDPYFYLQFGPLFPPPGNIFSPVDGDLGDFLAAPFQKTYLYLVSTPGCIPGGPGCSRSNAATTTFAVPEPGSVALVLVALGIAGLARSTTRRRVFRTVHAA